jgi:hypothetical protein
MAHTFLDPNEVAILGSALVRGDLVLGQLVGRTVETKFTKGKGASVDIRMPATLQARTRAVGAVTEITTDELTETYQSVQITEQAYSAVDLTDADLTLNLHDFGQQVLAPQAIAVGEHIEDTIADRLATVTASGIAYSSATPVKTLTAVRKELRDMKVPASGLVAVVGTRVYADMLDSGAFDNDKAGNADALRNAQVGNVRGFRVVESNRVPEDDMFVYHRDAVQLVMAAPAAPRGASFAASVAQDGYGLSWIMDYDARTLQDRSVLSVFLGTGLLSVKRAQGDSVLPVIRVTAGA